MTSPDPGGKWGRARRCQNAKVNADPNSGPPSQRPSTVAFLFQARHAAANPNAVASAGTRNPSTIIEIGGIQTRLLLDRFDRHSDAHLVADHRLRIVAQSIIAPVDCERGFKSRARFALHS